MTPAKGRGVDADLTVPDATQLSFAGGIGNDVASGQGEGGDDTLTGGDRGYDECQYDAVDTVRSCEA